MKWFLVLALLVSAALSLAEEVPLELPATDSTPLKPETAAAAGQEFAKLSSPDAAIRAEAGRKLMALDLAVLPWLKRQLQGDAAVQLSDSAQAAAAEVVKLMEMRNDLALLAYGTPVALDLKQVYPQDICAALERQTDNRVSTLAQWLQMPAKHDFKYSGNYWGAVELLCRLFPPDLPGKARDLEDVWQRRADKNDRPDVPLFGLEPAAIRGICTVRAARVSLEREAGGLFLTIKVSAKLEERFVANELTVVIKGFKFSDGQTVPPLEEPPDKFAGRGFKRTATASIRLTEALRAAKTVSVTGTLDFTPYEMRALTLDVTPQEIVRRLPGGLTLTVTPGAGEVKAKLVADGADALPNNMDGAEFLAALDPAGKRVGNVTSTSSMGGKSLEVKLSFGAGAMPPKIVVRVPRPLPKFNGAFTLPDAPLPLAEKLLKAPQPAPADQF